jgi:hypothetical protein
MIANAIKTTLARQTPPAVAATVGPKNERIKIYVVLLHYYLKNSVM